MNILTNAISDLCNKFTLDISPIKKTNESPKRLKFRPGSPWLTEYVPGDFSP